RPENKEELYNLWHTQIRNVVEKILGIFKGRFPILLSPRGFDFESTTVPLFRALAALHSFIWMHNSQRVNIEEDTLLICFMRFLHALLPWRMLATEHPFRMIDMGLATKG
ncbi:hypothetical protein DFJ73DRAFT_621016, partial [Zopfochytrium polystomum]